MQKEKFSSWIKRPVNFNFFSVLMISVILLVIAGLCMMVCVLVGLSLPESVDDITGGSDNPGGGFALLFGGIGYGLAIIGMGILFLMGVILPAFIGLLSGVLGIIAKQLHKKGKITAYRIIMTIIYLILSILFIGIILLCLSELGFFTILLLLCSIVIMIILIIGIKNTYSKRILN